MFGTTRNPVALKLQIHEDLRTELEETVCTDSKGFQNIGDTLVKLVKTEINISDIIHIWSI